MALFTRKSQQPQTTGATAATATLELDPALAALTGDYAIDPAHSRLGFTARHAMVTNVRGAFTSYEGALHLDGTDVSRSTATLDIKMDSVDTGSADRDGHLKSGDFFDAEQFPLMTFRTTGAEFLGGEDFRITGDLTIKDVTRQVAIDLEFTGSAQDPFGNDRVGFEGRTEILRSDWGLTWNAALETGGVLVSDKIKLTFDISAIKQG